MEAVSTFGGGKWRQNFGMDRSAIGPEFFRGLRVFVDVGAVGGAVVAANMRRAGAQITTRRCDADCIVSERAERPRTQGARLVAAAERVVSIAQVPWARRERTFVVIAAPGARPLFRDVTEYPQITARWVSADCFASPFARAVTGDVGPAPRASVERPRKYCAICRAHFEVSDEEHRGGEEHQRRVHDPDTFRALDALISVFPRRI